jgi:hypothetical protein
LDGIVMPGGAARGFPKGVYGVGRRETLYPGEDEYFKNNPHVAGMAAEDDQIIINPYSKLSEKEKDAVILNEAARVHMRKGLMDAPRYELTPEQTERLKGYSSNMDDIRQTLAARILSGDPSAGKATPEQLEYAQRLRRFMGVE